MDHVGNRAFQGCSLELHGHLHVHLKISTVDGIISVNRGMPHFQSPMAEYWLLIGLFCLTAL
jgi:hypothetical protein